MGTSGDQHGLTFIDQADLNQHTYKHQQVYETSPPTQKQKGMTSVNAVGAMKQLVNSSVSKSRQPNHIISSGGIISTKLASATV